MVTSTTSNFRSTSPCHSPIFLRQSLSISGRATPPHPLTPERPFRNLRHSTRIPSGYSIRISLRCRGASPSPQSKVSADRPSSYCLTACVRIRLRSLHPPFLFAPYCSMCLNAANTAINPPCKTARFPQPLGPLAWY